MVNAVYSSSAFAFDVASETAFNSGTVGTDFGALGIMAKFTSYELDNAWTEAYEIGIRYPQAYYTAGLQAPVAMDFYFCQDNVGWMAFVLGAATGGTYTVGQTVQTGMVRLGTPQGDIFTIGGIAFSTCKFNVATGSPVTITLTGTGTSFSTVAGTLTPGSIPTQLLTWKDISIGSTTTATITSSLVQSVNFTIDTGAKLYYALGSAQYQTYLPLQSKITCEIVAFHNDASALANIYQLISEGTVVVNIGSHTATFTGCYLTKGVLALEPVKEVLDTIDFSAINVIFI